MDGAQFGVIRPIVLYKLNQSAQNNEKAPDIASPEADEPEIQTLQGDALEVLSKINQAIISITSNND